MSTTDELLRHNATFAANFRPTDSAARGAKVAVVACMDARLDPAAALGLRPGDAHVIRNAGGILSEDVLRSLVISQRLLGTTEVILVHHTDCGMETFTDEELAGAVESELGFAPPFAFGAFRDAQADLRAMAAGLRDSPFLVHREIRGFVYEVETGRLREVDLG